MSDDINSKTDETIIDNVNIIYTENTIQNDNIIDGENYDSNESINDSYENTDEGVNEDIEVNVLNDEYKEKESETMPIEVENNNYRSINDIKKHKGGMRKRILSYIIVGVICSTLGGVGSAIVTMNMMKLLLKEMQ